MALLVGLPSGGRPGQGLVPLAPGTTSVFETTADGKPAGRHVSVVTGPALLVGAQGRPTAVAISDHYDDYHGSGTPLDGLSYFGWHGGEFLSYGFRFRGTFYPTTPAEPTAELPLTAGRSWHWDGQQGGEQAQATSTLVRYGSVRALGRTLPRCLRYRTTSVSTAAGGSKSTDLTDTWVCPGLGTVKVRDVTGGHVYVETLVRLSTPGRTVAAPGAPPVFVTSRSASAPGSGPGVDPQRSNAVSGAGAPGERPAWTIDLQNDAQVAGNATLTVAADSNGTVSSIDRRTGQVLWRVTVPAPLSAPPVVAGPVVLIADAEKHLQAFDLRTGAVGWTATFPDVLAAAPAAAGSVVVAVTQDDAVRALRLSDGRPLWTAHLSSLTDTPPAIVAGTVIVGDREGTLTAFSLSDGADRWESSLQGLLSAGPDAGGGLVVATDDGGVVYGFDARSGRLRWERYVGSTVELAPAVAGGRVVAVAGERTLLALSGKGGGTEWSSRLPAPIAAGPIVLGDHVLVQSEEGSLTQVALASGATEREIELPAPTSPVSAGPALTYFGGTLVATLRSELPYRSTSFVALPAAQPRAPQGDAGGGVAFRETAQRIAPPVGAAGPIAPPALTGKGFLFPGWDGKLWQVPPGGRPASLATTRLSFFAVPDGDLFLLQEGTDLVAIPQGGGSPRWRFPIGTASPASTPAVSGSTVAVPEAGIGLAGLDAATGRPRWLYRASGRSGSPPLALPVGGLAWAGPTGLVRIDAATGRVLWSLPGVVSFSPLAASGGLIAVAGFYRSVQTLLAVDARTGRLRWEEQLPAGTIGPAAGGSVVVAPGGDGVVRAFALTTGRQLWSVPLRTALDGPPVILGGRVALAQKGREEDLDAQAHTLTVHDLRSGRLLGLLQLPGAGTANALAETFAAAGRSSVVEYAAGYLFVVGLSG